MNWQETAKKKGSIDLDSVRVWFAEAYEFSIGHMYVPNFDEVDNIRIGNDNYLSGKARNTYKIATKSIYGKYVYIFQRIGHIYGYPDGVETYRILKAEEKDKKPIYKVLYRKPDRKNKAKKYEHFIDCPLREGTKEIHYLFVLTSFKLAKKRIEQIKEDIKRGYAHRCIYADFHGQGWQEVRWKYFTDAHVWDRSSQKVVLIDFYDRARILHQKFLSNKFKLVDSMQKDNTVDKMKERVIKNLIFNLFKTVKRKHHKKVYKQYLECLSSKSYGDKESAYKGHLSSQINEEKYYDAMDYYGKQLTYWLASPYFRDAMQDFNEGKHQLKRTVSKLYVEKFAQLTHQLSSFEFGMKYIEFVFNRSAAFLNDVEGGLLDQDNKTRAHNHVKNDAEPFGLIIDGIKKPVDGFYSVMIEWRMHIIEKEFFRINKKLQRSIFLAKRRAELIDKAEEIIKSGSKATSKKVNKIVRMLNSGTIRKDKAACEKIINESNAIIDKYVNKHTSISKSLSRKGLYGAGTFLHVLAFSVAVANVYQVKSQEFGNARAQDFLNIGSAFFDVMEKVSMASEFKNSTTLVSIKGLQGFSRVTRFLGFVGGALDCVIYSMNFFEHLDKSNTGKSIANLFYAIGTLAITIGAVFLEGMLVPVFVIGGIILFMVGTVIDLFSDEINEVMVWLRHSLLGTCYNCPGSYSGRCELKDRSLCRPDADDFDDWTDFSEWEGEEIKIFKSKKYTVTDAQRALKEEIEFKVKWPKTASEHVLSFRSVMSQKGI